MCESIGRDPTNNNNSNIGFILPQSISLDLMTNVGANYNSPNVTNHKNYIFTNKSTKNTTNRHHTRSIQQQQQSLPLSLAYDDQHHTKPFLNDYNYNNSNYDEVPIPISWIDSKPEFDCKFTRRQSTSSTISATSCTTTCTSASSTSFPFEPDYNLHDEHSHSDLDEVDEILCDIPVRPLTADKTIIDTIPPIPICENITNPTESYDSDSESDAYSNCDGDNIPAKPPPNIQPKTQQINHTNHNEQTDDINTVYCIPSECKLDNECNDDLQTQQESPPNIVISHSSCFDDLPPLPTTPDTLSVSFCNNCKPIQDDESEIYDEIERAKHSIVSQQDNGDQTTIPHKLSFEQISDEILPCYQWLRCVPNEQNYGAYYKTFQREVMNNPFCNVTAGEFNDLLKKCQFISTRWLGERIRSTKCGHLGKTKWKAGEKIAIFDLFAIKLYTDYEICQREMKKCYRPPIDGDEFDMIEYEKRLCHFSHWRRILTTAIMKYGTVLRRHHIFYHGINKLMKLNIHPTQRCDGPFSASTDIDIARGFATRHGFIIKMCSKYPRLATDYFFDAAPISAFPDEKEYIIGSLYTRILNVELGCSNLEIEDLINDKMVEKLTCFIICSLIDNHLYSYDEYLEVFFNALLITDCRYNTEWELGRICDGIYDQQQRKNILSQMQQIADLIPDVIKEKFIKCREQKRTLKLDTISKGMKHLFYGNKNTLSMQQIYKYTPNISELHLYESYDINDEFIGNFKRFIIDYTPKTVKLDTIKVYKYSFDGPSDQFLFEKTKSISKYNINELSKMGWFIHEYHDENCYRFTLTKKRKKIKS